MLKDKKILIINKYFYPGYKAGGPIQSLKNICDALHNSFDISVLCWDRDYLDGSSYPGVDVDHWNDFNGYKVFYAKDKIIDSNIIENIVLDTAPDLIYLNSFFDKISIFAIKVAKKFNIPVVLAPRGEFSEGALKIKKIKKTLFLRLIKTIGFYNGITYHATNNLEKSAIEYVLGNVPVFISENIVKKPMEKVVTLPYKDNIRFVYLSRITPKKNLLFFLNIIKNTVTTKNIILDIYGPIDDFPYWDKCQDVINNIVSDKVEVNYLGAVSPENFEEIYKNTHFSILPTLGENFGHSIYESLSYGVPVIISDLTPWLGLKQKLAGFDLDLSNSSFKKLLSNLDGMDDELYQKYRHGALSLSKEYYYSLNVNSLVNNFIEAAR